MHSLLNVLATMVANKKILGAWMVALSLGVGTLGEKVFVSRTEEITEIKGNIKVILETTSEMKLQLGENSKKLDKILAEQSRVEIELKAHEAAQVERDRLEAEKRGKK